MSLQLTDTNFDLLTEIYPHDMTVNEAAKILNSPLSVPVAKSVETNGKPFESTKRSRAVQPATEVKKIPALKLSKPGPLPTCTIDDLTTLVNLLTPIQNIWHDLGGKLAIDPQKLENIRQKYGQRANQCLREMLREYLQHHYPPPTWDKLANHVDEYNHSVAISIIKKGEKYS